MEVKREKKKRGKKKGNWGYGKEEEVMYQLYVYGEDAEDYLRRWGINLEEQNDEYESEYWSECWR